MEFSIDHHLPFHSKNNHKEFALQQTEFLILQDMKMLGSAHIKNLASGAIRGFTHLTSYKVKNTAFPIEKYRVQSIVSPPTLI